MAEKTKTNLLKLVCRMRIVTTAVAWFQVRAFCGLVHRVGGQVPTGHNAPPRHNRPGALAIYSAVAVPVRCAFEWHPLRQLRQLWAGAGAIRPAERYRYLFARDPKNAQGLANPVNRRGVRWARRWRNTTCKTPETFSAAAGICSSGREAGSKRTRENCHTRST